LKGTFCKFLWQLVFENRVNKKTRVWWKSLFTWSSPYLNTYTKQWYEKEKTSKGKIRGTTIEILVKMQTSKSNYVRTGFSNTIWVCDTNKVCKWTRFYKGLTIFFMFDRKLIQLFKVGSHINYRKWGFWQSWNKEFTTPSSQH